MFFEVTARSIETNDEEGRLKLECNAREDRFSMLEQGFDDHLMKLNLQAMRAGKGSWDWWRVQLASENSADYSSLGQSFGHHFENDAIKPLASLKEICRVGFLNSVPLHAQIGCRIL